MSESFNTTTINEIGKQLKEPAWITQIRRDALAKHQALPWPHPSDDVWRRTNVSLLDPMRGFAPAEPALFESISLSDSQIANLTHPLGEEHLLVRAGGTWLTDYKPDGFVIDDLAHAAHTDPDPIRQVLLGDGFTPAEQKLTSLNSAFHHDDLFIKVPAHATVSRPVRLVHVVVASANQALFPMTIITVGAGSTLTLIDEYVSLESRGTEKPHLINGRIELILEPNASVNYVRLQRWGAHAREFVLQRAVLAEGATLTLANLTLGASLSKAHIVTKLAGPHASTKLYGFVFGHGAQHVDQHTLQDHQAPHTMSDLNYRAALRDESRLVYTGLIRIARQAKQTNAYQSNHNLLLSEGAHAETIPMLEILADDVQCKHGASISPIDEEQAFYAMTRGIPYELAERLIVMGFIETIIQQVPFPPLQERLRQEIEGGLRQQPGQGAGDEGRGKVFSN